ncbi:MAG: hypothetical protein QW177_04750 [Candidatus Nitrosotenuis sp.]
MFGQVAQVEPDLFVVTQIINPNGDLCYIQQLKPLSNGHFITDATPLTGRICGLAGDYTVKVFYGESTTTNSFRVLNEKVKEEPDAEQLASATSLVQTKITSLEDKLSGNQLAQYQSKLDQIKSISASESAILQLRDLYSELLLSYYDESDVFEVDNRFRPAIETAFATINGLVGSNTLDTAEANSIKKQTFDAMFYTQIGRHNDAIGILSDVYVQITNVDPQKVSTPQPLTYEQLDDLLLNLMTKSNSIMSRQLKEELGFIFARGTGPLYSEELGDLVDMLTKARTLDATLKRDDQLTLLIKTEWGTLRESLLEKPSLSEFLEQKAKLDKLYEANMLLRNLDKVDRFTSAEPKSELAAIIEPKLNELLSKLQSATSANDIISVGQEISDMRNVIDISSRISSTIEFSKRNNADQKLITSFESLLEKVRNANTLAEILQVVSEFDSTINDLREKRSPLSLLKFEYEKLKTKAELQADYQSLVEINNALKAIDTAMEIEKGNQSVSKIEKIEVLLSWASQNRPVLQAKLDSYSKDAYKIRASDILQRAKSLENLLELGNTHNRFLPGYTDFTTSMKIKVDTARNLVMKGDLDGADNMVRELFAEWQIVSKKYSEDPYGSEIGYTGDEIKRIEYRKKIEELSDFATAFYNSDFEPHSSEFNKMKEKAYELVDYGNFVDAEEKIEEIRQFLSENMVLKNKKIIFDITYDAEKQIWVMSGAVDKQVMDRRQNLYLTVYDMQGNTHSTLAFSDTKQGDLYTQWYAPTEPGLYVVVLQWQNNQASQIVDVPEKTTTKHSSEDLKNVDYAREFEELQSFIQTFGGTNYVANKGRFDPVISELKNSLHNKDFSTSSSKLKELRSLIERYLPSRSATAVIDAYVEGDKLYVSGAIYKTIAFSEDIYVDVFDQKGNRVEEIRLKDNTSGYFNQVISRPFEPGTYVAQLQYHDLTVSDFFRVN